MSALHSTRGSAVILEQTDPDDWDQFIDGEIDADELRRRAFEGDR